MKVRMPDLAELAVTSCISLLRYLRSLLLTDPRFDEKQVREVDECLRLLENVKGSCHPSNK